MITTRYVQYFLLAKAREEQNGKKKKRTPNEPGTTLSSS